MTMTAPSAQQPELPDLDYQQLDRLLDKVKTKVFLGTNAAFLGHIMCSMNFIWSTQIPTACTDGNTLWWNPVWFLELPERTRCTVLVHELWHPGLLHNIRCGTRNPTIWNYAADIYINNMLHRQNYSFDGTQPWMDLSYDDNAVTEDIYDDLIQKGVPPPPPIWGVPGVGADQGDIVQIDPGNHQAQAEALNKVVAAAATAGLSGHQAGKLPGEVELVLNRFLKPKLPWDQLLYRFFSEKADADYSWSRPNRRYSDIYLPSLRPDNNGLAHVIYYVDASGSVTDPEIIRMNSEVKYIKEMFNPERLTLVIFDTKIRKEYEFGPDDPFDQIVVVGRGGTCLKCVREHMIEHKPTAAVVFSDMQVAPMEPLPPGLIIPTIWIGVNARSDVKVPHGEVAHIRE